MRHFKIDDSDAVKTFNEYLSSRLNLLFKTREFSQMFAPLDKVQVIYRKDGAADAMLTFQGLKFAEPMPSPLWTEPEPETGIQRPEAMLPDGALEEERQAHSELIGKWVSGFRHMQKSSIGITPFFREIELTEPTGGFRLFILEDDLYLVLKSDDDPAPRNPKAKLLTPHEVVIVEGRKQAEDAARNEALEGS